MNRHFESLLITDFSNLATQKWQIINDAVMGGVSTSQFQINEAGHGVFLGTVSLENDGGFASVHNYAKLNFSGFSQFVIRVKGDGNRYSFRFRSGKEEERNEWYYELRFETIPNKWIDVTLPFSEFVATYRGRKLPDAPPPDFSSIWRYGFLISDKQEGEFRLEISTISVY